MKTKPIDVIFAECGPVVGGSQRSTLDIVTQLERVGPTVRPIYAVPAGSDILTYAKSRLRAQQIVVVGERAFTRTSDVIWILRYVLAIIRFLRSRPVDIVHCTNETLLWWLIPCRLFGVKAIWNVRAQLEPGTKSAIRRWTYLVLCRHVMFVSAATRESVFPKGIPARIHQSRIPNFIPAQIADAHVGSPPEPYRRTVIGFIGRLDDSVKNADWAASIARSALEAGTDCEFQFWGEGSESTYARLREALGQAHRHRIRFAGTFEDPYEVYPGIDVLLMTSRAEGFPRVILEAAMFSVPTVGHAVGGIAELIDDGSTGRLFRTTQGACEALEYLCDRDARTKMGRTARSEFKASFGVEHVIGLYSAYYAKCLTHE